MEVNEREMKKDGRERKRNQRKENRAVNFIEYFEYFFPFKCELLSS